MGKHVPGGRLLLMDVNSIAKKVLDLTDLSARVGENSLLF